MIQMHIRNTDYITEENMDNDIKLFNMVSRYDVLAFRIAVSSIKISDMSSN